MQKKMQQMVVVLVLLLYAAFALIPITDITVFSRTLLLSPGEIMALMLTMGIVVKVLLQKRNNAQLRRPRPVIHFLTAYILLAAVFLAPTLMFFVLHNELAESLLRSLMIYLRWVIALFLFFYASDSNLRFMDLRLIVWLLMVTFIAGVSGSIFMMYSDFNVFNLLTNTLTSLEMRAAGQSGDPNQLGEIAAFLSVIGLMGALYEKKIKIRLVFLLLTGGTALVLLLTQSRESFLTMFVALFCIFIFMARDHQYLKAFGIFFVLVLGSGLAVMNIPRIAETLATLGAGDTSYALSERDIVWRTSLDIILRYPFGIGIGNMSYVTNNTITGAHNAFLQSAVSAGFVGFIIFACFLALLFRLLWVQGEKNPDHWIVKAYFAFLLGYVATSMVSDHFIGFFTLNSIFFGLLGFVACAR